MLYPECSRVGQGNLVLRNTASHFPQKYKLCGGTKRRDLFQNQDKEIKILHISSPRVGIEPTLNTVKENLCAGTYFCNISLLLIQKQKREISIKQFRL